MKLLTRTLDLDSYGIWATAMVTINLAVGCTSLGLHYALSRFLAAKSDGEKKEVREEFYSALAVVAVVSLVFSSLFVLLAPAIARALFEGATDVVRLVGLIILVTSLELVFLGLFHAFRQMKRFSLFTLCRAYGEIGIIAFLALNGHGLLHIVLAVLITRSILLGILAITIKLQIGIQRPRFSRLKEYLYFSLPTVPTLVATHIVNSSDRYVIGILDQGKMNSVGVYSACYAVGTLPMMIAMVLGFVLFPTLSRLYDEGELDEVKTHLAYSLKFFLAVAIPFVFGAAVLSEQVLTILSTPEIASASEAKLIVSLVALAVLVFGIDIIAPLSILSLVKRTGIIAVVWISAALLNVVLNIIIVPHIGIVGAAITTLLVYILALGARMYFSLKEITFSFEWSFVAKSLFASLVMSLLILAIDPIGMWNTIAAIIAGIITYTVVLAILRGFKGKEIAFLRGLIMRSI